MGYIEDPKIHSWKEMKQLESILHDPAVFHFQEGFISIIGKDGKWLGYGVRCILFGSILYILGGICAFLSDTLFPDPTRGLTTGYLLDAYIPTLLMVTGLTSLFAIRALRGLGDKLVFTDQYLNYGTNLVSTKAEKGHLSSASASRAKTIERLNLLVQDSESNTWIRHSKGWYYSSSLILASIGFLVGCLTILSNKGSWFNAPHAVSSIFFISCCIVIGYTVGALVFISARGIAIVRRYCENYVLPSSILTLDPDKASGLKKMGQFSFDLDFAAAIPSLAFFVSYLSGTPILGPVSVICLTIYTIIMIGILVLPLHPFHVKMASAKEDALMKVDLTFREVCSRIPNEERITDPRLISKLNDICFLRERITKKPVWPLSYEIRLKFMATVPFPILLSLFSTLLSKLLGIT